jgi:hypothetical protein
MTRVERIRDLTLRRMAERRGLKLKRSYRRDPLAPGHGLYKLVRTATGETVFGDGPGGFAATLDEVEAFLNRPRG